jgi:hypothetical protein
MILVAAVQQTSAIARTQLGVGAALQVLQGNSQLLLLDKTLQERAGILPSELEITLRRVTALSIGIHHASRICEERKLNSCIWFLTYR